MKNLKNPVYRFIRGLGINASHLAELLKIKERHFQWLSAKQPGELISIIEDAFPVTFTRDEISKDVAKLKGLVKERIIQDLLRDSRGTNRKYPDAYLKSGADTQIGVFTKDSTQLRVEIRDLKPLSPVTAGGNVLTREFRRLLDAQPGWLSLQNQGLPLGVNIQKVWERCAAKSSDGFSLANFQDELELATKKEHNKVLRFIGPHIEFEIIDALFLKLRSLYLKRNDIDGFEASEFARLKEWAIVQFNLSRLCFKDAMATGKIFLTEEKFSERVRLGIRTPIPEHLHSMLYFLSDPPPRSFFVAKGKK